MAQKDKVQKTLESYNDVFADIVNVLLFEGRRVVKEEELTEAQPFSYYKMDGSKVRAQERDVAKYWNSGQIRLSFIGLENQMKTDRRMPLRVIGYDGAAYRTQLLEKHKKACYPTVTLVLYFGTKHHWKNNRSLKEAVQIPPELEPYVSDYKINVFELAWLTDEQIESFNSDFREVALFLRCKRTGELFTGSTRKLEHVMEILDLFRVMADNDRNLIDAIEGLPEKDIEGGIGMCNVVQQWVDVGRQEQAVEAAVTLINKYKATPEDAAKDMNAPLELVLERLKSKQ